jgi:hypothetical protein
MDGYYRRQLGVHSGYPDELGCEVQGTLANEWEVCRQVV